MNTLKHEIYDHKRWKRQALLNLLRKKSERKRFAREFYLSQVQSESSLEKLPLNALLEMVPHVHLENFLSRNGNVTPYELIVIGSLVASKKPSQLLEIGTFDGNTTLQLALNSPDHARIYTIDLPPGFTETKQPVLESDLQFIHDKKKQTRKFEGTKWAEKIEQHFGDSTDYDFTHFTKEGLLDFIFIDGGHSYPCVKSDTENALKVIAKNGMILWHDFTPLFGGVFTFLQELSKELPLVHIEGTNLVILNEYRLRKL